MNSYKKGSNFIIIIFVVLILLPSFILVPVTNFILNNGGTAFLELPIFAKISALVASFSTMLGIFTIYSQIEKDKRVSSSRFLVDLNDSIMSFESTRNVYKKLLDLENKKYDRKLYEKAFKTDGDKYDLLSYFGFFENLQFFLEKKIIKISEVNDLFSKRFFIAINNPYVQEEISKNAESWTNIYKLYKTFVTYKNDKNIKIPYKQYALSKTKEYLKYSKYYFNYKSIKNNLFIIFILSSSIFTLLLFFLLLAFGYPVNNISSIIGSCGTVVGALAIFFQLNVENGINRSRFLFELNKSFISKKYFKEINVLASYNLDYNKKFNLKKNLFEKIKIENLFNYLTFFESVNIMLENHALNISEVNSFFNFRFFIVINNPYVQNILLIKDNIYFKNIYKLNDKLTKYRRFKLLGIIYSNYSLEKIDINYKQLIK